ncbi:MAG: hypothetical protein IJN34_03440 [Clostridia bacterium]|nr:hypothetical protein [Clostridia bacterium]
MKRILCTIMVLVMAISLFACNKSPDSEELAELDTEVGISGESGESQGEEKPSQKPSENPDQPTGNDEGEEQKPSEENKEEKDPAQSENKPSEEKEPSAETEQKPQQEKPKEEGKDKLSHLINDTSGTKLKILCQNLRFNSQDEWGTDNFIGIRRYRFQALMEKYDPDVVGLQECDKTWIEYLQQDYGREYTMFYQYRGSPTGSDEASPVMWKTDKYKMVDSGYFWLSDTPDVSSASFIRWVRSLMRRMPQGRRETEW